MEKIISEGIADLLAIDASLEIVDTTDFEGMRCLAIVVADIEIVDPHRSACGRFEVDSRASYGLTPDIADKLVQINQAIRAKVMLGSQQRQT